MNDPKILLWDIETGFNVARIFSLWPGNSGIHYNAIQQERYIICASWKWLGEKKVHSVDISEFRGWKKRPSDDLKVVKRIHRVLSEADAIVAHYGDNFDTKFFNSRCIYHELSPPPPTIQIDTFKIAKKHFLFNCNRLDYLGEYLGVGRKIKTTHQLWHGCLDGDEKAVKKMVRYNKQDVRLLEDVYKKLAPYADTKINHGLYKSGEVCPSCGGRSLQSRGYRKTVTQIYRRHQCLDCGKWSSSRQSEKIAVSLK